MSEAEQMEARRLYAILGFAALVLALCMGTFMFTIGRLTSAPTESEATSTPLPPPVVNIQTIRAEAELSTVEFSTVTEIYNETAPEGWLDDFFGNKERLLMLVYGDVEAGFDLSKLSEENLWVEGSRVRLILPPPEILNSSIDFERTHIVYYENDFLFDENNPNLQGEALAQSKKAIEEAAIKAGIFEHANRYGQAYFENLLYSLGFTDVEVGVDAQFFEE